MADFAPRWPRNSLRGIAAALGMDTDSPAYDSSAKTADADGDIIERLEYLQGLALGTTVPTGLPASYNPVLGYKVTKTGDIAAMTDPLFDITGLVQVSLMIGVVSSVLATSSSLSLNTSTNDMVIAASTTVTSDALATVYVVSGDVDLGFMGGGTPTVDGAIMKVGTIAPFWINGDQIEQNVNSAGTGKIDWSLWYWPLAASAIVVAAA